MAVQNIVTLANLGSGFDIDTVNEQINVSSGSGVTATIYQEFYFGYSSNGTTSTGTRNCTITRAAVGRWSVSFSAPHPDGTAYHPSITTEEEGNLRDNPNVTVVQNSKTANGFTLQITTGDNGGSADTYVDAPFSFSVASPIDVITPV